MTIKYGWGTLRERVHFEGPGPGARGPSSECADYRSTRSIRHSDDRSGPAERSIIRLVLQAKLH
eukprot:325399-Hanusia_phi.AAC.1